MVVNSYFWNIQYFIYTYICVKSSWLELPSGTAKDMQMKLNIPRRSPASLGYTETTAVLLYINKMINYVSSATPFLTILWSKETGTLRLCSSFSLCLLYYINYII